QDSLRNLFIHELEFAVGAQFTPSIRGDLIYSFGRSGNRYLGNFEEAYLTFLDLPLGFQARAGKFKAAFGKANQLHTHARPWIDVPAPLQNFFGEEGLVGTGVSLSHMVPNPWNAYSELIFQLIDTNAGGELGRAQTRGPAGILHWKNVFDL